jgi:hypothetical protein
MNPDPGAWKHLLACGVQRASHLWGIDKFRVQSSNSIDIAMDGKVD